MSNSLNSMAQSANRPVVSGLLVARYKGLSVRTTTVWAWKYGLSLRAAVTNAKASFSMGGYLFLAPRSAQLTLYTGFCTFSSSLIKVALTVAAEMAR